MSFGGWTGHLESSAELSRAKQALGVNRRPLERATAGGESPVGDGTWPRVG